MANKKSSCLLHLIGVKDDLHCFSVKTFNKFKTCREQWLKYSGKMTEIAKESLEICGNHFDDNTEDFDFTQFVFHKYCYRQFTDISKIKREELKHAKQVESLKHDQPNSSADTPAPPSPKRARSSMAMPSTSFGEVPQPRNRHVLPRMCILC